MEMEKIKANAKLAVFVGSPRIYKSVDREGEKVRTTTADLSDASHGEKGKERQRKQRFCQRYCINNTRIDQQQHFLFGRNDLSRIEHCQVLESEDERRVHKLGTSRRMRNGSWENE